MIHNTNIKIHRFIQILFYLVIIGLVGLAIFNNAIDLKLLGLGIITLLIFLFFFLKFEKIMREERLFLISMSLTFIIFISVISFQYSQNNKEIYNYIKKNLDIKKSELDIIFINKIIIKENMTEVFLIKGIKNENIEKKVKIYLFISEDKRNISAEYTFKKSFRKYTKQIDRENKN